jgi:hypothetical protein
MCEPERHAAGEARDAIPDALAGGPLDEGLALKIRDSPDVPPENVGRDLVRGGEGQPALAGGDVLRSLTSMPPGQRQR